MVAHHAAAAVTAALLLLVACQRPPAEEAARPTPDTAQPPAPSEGDAAAEPAAACAPIERPPVQSGDHLIGDQEPPVPYSSTPPTSGWHASGRFDIDVHGPEDPLSEPRQVSVLESDAVVVTYRDLGDEERAQLEALVREQFPGRAAVTPYAALDPGEVAMAAWGVLQRCDGLDLEAVAAFIDEHADEQLDSAGH